MLSFKVEASVSLDAYNAKRSEFKWHQAITVSSVGGSSLATFLGGNNEWAWLAVTVLWLLLRWPVFALDFGRLFDREQNPYKALLAFVPFARIGLVPTLGLPSPEEVVKFGPSDTTIKFGDYEFILEYAPEQLGYFPETRRFSRLPPATRAALPEPTIDENRLRIAKMVAASARESRRSPASSGSGGRPGYTWVRETPTRRGHWRKLS